VNPAKEHKLYNLDKPLWSIYLAMKYNPQHKKQLWSLLSDKDRQAIRAAVAGSKSKP
jgi:hypothetical protein